MKISTGTLRRIEKLEAKTPKHGQWGRGLSGQMIWDPWNPEPTEEEAHAAAERVRARIEGIAERMRADPDWRESTEAEKAETIAWWEANYQVGEDGKRHHQAK